jgi:hypothetical protein
MSSIKIDSPLVSSVGHKKIVRKKSTSEGFYVEENESTNNLGSIQVALSPQGLDALFLSLTEQHSIADQKAMDHGESLLKQLDNIRLGLVTGSLRKETLLQLKELDNTIFFDGIHEKLQFILVEIQTRVQVELAKLGQ